MSTRPMRGVCLLACAMILVWCGPAYAYIDAGMASMMFQMLIGGILAGLFTMKLYWARIKQFFSGRSEAADDESEEEEGHE